MHLVRGAMIAALLGGMSTAAWAQYPEQPITLIVPWAAGGGTDAIARTLGAQLEEELGTPVNVVNRTGGAGVVGHAEIVNARPDGYTIGLATIELTTFYWSGTAEFTYEDLTPIALINEDASAFNVSAGSEWQDLRAALDAIKAAPSGTYKLSGMAPGAGYHLALAGLLQTQDIDPAVITVVPSQGAAPGFQELAAGGVDLVPSSLPEAKAMIDAGEVKTLAVLSAERLPAFPDVPTVEEAIGVPWAAGSWRGIAGPAGMPEEAVTVLREAIDKVWHSEAFQSFMNERGFGLRYASGDEFAAFLANQHEQNGNVMAALGLRNRD